MRTLQYIQAINEALHEEMARDESVFVIGEDVDQNGGVFKATKGLVERFGARRTAELKLEPRYDGTVIPDTALRFMELRAGNDGNDLGSGHIGCTYYTNRTEPEINAELSRLKSECAPELDAIGVRIADIRKTTRFFHFMRTGDDSPVVPLLIEAARKAGAPEPKPVGACLSDLSVLLKYGSPNTVGFGIGRDFDAYGGAHQADEFVECEKLV